MNRFQRRWIWTTVLVVWAAVVLAGIAGITRYSMTPGAPAQFYSDWPRAIPFAPTDREITLVLSVHPKCPCSRATMSELAKLVSQCSGKIGVYILLIKPAGTPADWERGAIFDAAQHIPGARVMVDQDAAWSKQFGAATSGQIFAFDSTGRLRFSGGITASRGHEGDNAGSDLIASLLSGNSQSTGHTPVYGCSLGIPVCDKPPRDER